MHVLKQTLTVFLCAAFLLSSTYSLAQSQPQGEDPNAANLTPQEIDNLVAPIALYPDALVAQVLAGATFPDQITAANQWLKGNSSLTGDALLQAVNQQPWDPSVKALTQFPSVLDNMANNLSWTSALGEAYYYQQADVMKAVQTLRKQAKAAGNLKSGQQITVVQQDPQTIVIQPANPQVVYVPTYNPTVVYGTPYSPPGYSTGAMVATGLISFGVGMAVGAAINNSCCGWGWNSWNTNWHGGNVVYNRNVYVSNSNVYRNGGYRGGYNGARPTPYNANNRYNQNSNNRYGNRNTNVSGNTVNRGGNTVNINTGGNTNVSGNNRQNTNANFGNNRQRPGNTPTTQPANRPAAADRGFGQQGQTGTKTSALSGYDKGGNTRAQADRGRASYGGGGGGGRAAGGGGRRR